MIIRSAKNGEISLEMTSRDPQSLLTKLYPRLMPSGDKKNEGRRANDWSSYVAPQNVNNIPPS
jgi:hypothetical protein